MKEKFYVDIISQSLLEQHNTFKESLKEATSEFEELMNISEQIHRLAQENHLSKAFENPYTMVTAQVNISIAICWKHYSLE